MMAELDYICFKFQNFCEIKTQCLKDRELFVDPEFTSEVALGGDKDVESEPEKNPCVNLEEQCKENSPGNEENYLKCSPIRRVPKYYEINQRLKY